MQEISILPGRIRLKSAILYYNKNLARYINAYIDNLYGVKYSSVNHCSASILVVYDPQKTSFRLLRQNIKDAITSAAESKLQYANTFDEYYKTVEKRDKAERRMVIFGMIYAALKIKHSLFGKFFISTNITALQIASTVTIIGGYPLIKKLYKRFARHVPTDSDILLSLSALSLTLLRESSKGVLVLMLKAFNDYVKLSADAQGQRFVNQSMSKNTGLAWLAMSPGQEVLVPVQTLKAYDLISVHGGELIPAEGIVEEGKAVINSLYHTGQPVVTYLDNGNKAYEGMAVLSGELKIRIEKPPQIDAKADINKKELDIYKRVQSYQKSMTPVAMFAGALSFIFTGSIMNALSVLLVLTPSAAGTALSSGINSYTSLLKKYGIYIKNPNKIEKIKNTNHLVFDKTGTLTQGKMSIETIECFDKAYSSDELLKICAACEVDNYHPVSITIIDRAGGSYDAGKVKSSVLIPSKGVVALYDNHKVVIGSKTLMEEKHIDISESLAKYLYYEKALFTPVFVSIDDKLKGMIVLQDVVREDSHYMIKGLKNRGLNNISLLTGDVRSKACHLASSLGINRIYSECSCQDKFNIISEKKDGEIVMMVGDGVNDILAMNNADVSISFAESSCDRVKHYSDFIIYEDNMVRLPELITLSQKSYKKINESIAFSQAFNIALGIMAFFGRFDAFGAKSLNTVNSLAVLLLNKRIEHLSSGNVIWDESAKGP